MQSAYGIDVQENIQLQPWDHTLPARVRKLWPISGAADKLRLADNLRAQLRDYRAWQALCTRVAGYGYELNQANMAVRSLGELLTELGEEHD